MLLVLFNVVFAGDFYVMDGHLGILAEEGLDDELYLFWFDLMVYTWMGLLLVLLLFGFFLLWARLGERFGLGALFSSLGSGSIG